ncbi:hypothetical protein Dimus_005485, partial [Dionaea muscipula]
MLKTLRKSNEQIFEMLLETIRQSTNLMMERQLDDNFGSGRTEALCVVDSKRTTLTVIVDGYKYRSFGRLALLGRCCVNALLLLGRLLGHGVCNDAAAWVNMPAWPRAA